MYTVAFRMDCRQRFFFLVPQTMDAELESHLMLGSALEIQVILPITGFPGVTHIKFISGFV